MILILFLKNVVGFKMSEWISVDERLPEEEKEVLIFLETENYSGINIDKITNPKDGNLWSITLKDYVKFWMPLPEPPNKKLGRCKCCANPCKFNLSEHVCDDCIPLCVSQDPIIAYPKMLKKHEIKGCKCKIKDLNNEIFNVLVKFEAFEHSLGPIEVVKQVKQCLKCKNYVAIYDE